jgi:hypothetical protein
MYMSAQTMIVIVIANALLIECGRAREFNHQNERGECRSGPAGQSQQALIKYLTKNFSISREYFTRVRVKLFNLAEEPSSEHV